MYFLWTFEILSVVTSVLTWLFPYGVFAVYLITKKRIICECCIVILSFKFMTVFSTSIIDFWVSKDYGCDIDGHIYKMS